MNPPDVSANGTWIGFAVDQFEGPLVRYAVRLTGNTESARDVVQETFLRLCRAERSEVEPHLAQWLFTVCRNRALEIARKESRMKTLTAVAAEETLSTEPSQTARIEQRETISRVSRFVETLPVNQQEVVRLKFQSDLSYRDIAAITGLSVTNVGYLLHTAIQKLRERMQED